MSDDDGRDEAFPSLPSPLSPGQRRAEDVDLMEGEGHGDVSKLAEVPAAKRKGVKRPQPKLDSQRLTSERGLPALRTLFDNVHFKGKGHEAEDLRLLMQKMENWAHRLFPKLQFEQFIDKVERLGAKKDVQTCLKRIRLDMPLTHEDYTSHGVEEEVAPESHTFSNPDPFGGSGFSDSLPGLTHSTPVPPGSPAPPAPPLTEEQLRRMELSRQRALEKKLARQQQPDAGGLDSQPVADELRSITSGDLNQSEQPNQEVEEPELELEAEAEPELEAEAEPEPSTQPPHAEAAPPSPKREEEEEEGGSAQPAQRASSCGED